MTKIDLNQIALFLRVVNAGSFTAAAKLLALPTSSVSRGVARLERELGTRLLQRTTRQFHLTDAGKQFYEQAEAALGALERATTTIAEGTEEVRGRVRLSLPSDGVDAFMAEVLADFQRRYPAVRLELQFTNRHVDLVQEGFDLALRAGKLADSSLLSRKITDTELALFAAPAYLARRGVPRTLAELAEHDCVLFERGRSWVLEGPRGSETLHPEGVLLVDSMTFLSLAIGAGFGIGLLPLVAAVGEQLGQQRPSLVRVLPEYAQSGAALSIVWPPSPFVPRRVMLLRDHLAERLRARYVACAKKLAEFDGTRGVQPVPPAPRADVGGAPRRASAAPSKSARRRARRK
jgi:DNA-binding transcriptional LysR family regulator